jgi:hypothetical protein
MNKRPVKTAKRDLEGVSLSFMIRHRPSKTIYLYDEKHYCLHVIDDADLKDNLSSSDETYSKYQIELREKAHAGFLM